MDESKLSQGGPCCCCGKFSIAIAVVNCNGITDDDFELYMGIPIPGSSAPPTISDTLIATLYESQLGSPSDECTGNTHQNRGHFIAPSWYNGPYPDSSNLYCGGSPPVSWQDYAADELDDMGDACVFQFTLRAITNHLCNNFGKIFFYRIIGGQTDSLCLMQTTDYEPATYILPVDDTDTYYCAWNHDYIGGIIFTSRVFSNCVQSDDGDGLDIRSGPYSSLDECYDSCGSRETYYLTRCDNKDCCRGYWCIGGGQCYGPATRLEAEAEADGGSVAGPFLDSDDCFNRGACYPYWCVQNDFLSTAYCIQARDEAQATYGGGGPTLTLKGGPYGSAAECNSAGCVFACPCCPDFFPSVITGVYNLPGVLTDVTVDVNINASCGWYGETSGFGGTVSLSLTFNSSCQLTYVLTVPPFVGPSTTYVGTDPSVYDCSTMPYSFTDNTTLYSGVYGSLALSVPFPFRAAAPAPALALSLPPTLPVAPAKRDCGCAKRKARAEEIRQRIRKTTGETSLTKGE